MVACGGAWRSSANRSSKVAARLVAHSTVALAPRAGLMAALALGAERLAAQHRSSSSQRRAPATVARLAEPAAQVAVDDRASPTPPRRGQGTRRARRRVRSRRRSRRRSSETAALGGATGGGAGSLADIHELIGSGASGACTQVGTPAGENRPE